MKNNDLKIYFDSKLSNLYDVGYLTTDLHQVLSYSELLSEHALNKADKYFGEKARPLNRYAKPLKSSRLSSEITEIEKGSLALWISGTSLVTNIVMAVVSIKANNELKKKQLSVKFEISPQDKNIQKHLNSYQNGNYGYGEEGLKNLFETLSKINYSVSITAEDIYSIEHVTNKYSQRMVKTIEKSLE